MPAEQVDAMLRSTPRRRQPGAPHAAGRHPVVTLLEEVARRTSIAYLRVQKGDDLVEWRRAT